MRSMGNITRPNLRACGVRKLLAKSLLICRSNQSKTNTKCKKTDDHPDSEAFRISKIEGHGVED